MHVTSVEKSTSTLCKCAAFTAAYPTHQTDMYVCTYTWKMPTIPTYLRTCTYVRRYLLHTNVLTYIHMYIHMHTSHICTYVHTYIRTYVCACIHTYVHTHTYIHLDMSLHNTQMISVRTHFKGTLSCESQSREPTNVDLTSKQV